MTTGLLGFHHYVWTFQRICSAVNDVSRMRCSFKSLTVYRVGKSRSSFSVIIMNTNEDEDDYMSDKFVENSKDVRPSLVFKQSTKRQLELERKHDEKNKKFSVQSRKQMESDLRQEGLEKRLGDDNKGFALMQKMGYIPGSSLGKEGSKGRVEPIGVNIKSDRGGLGRDEFLKQKRQEIMQMKLKMFERRKKTVALDEKEFVRQQQQKMLDRQISRDLYNCQKSCRHLDQAIEITEAAESWFWPQEIKPEDENESEEDDEEEKEQELEPFEKLEILNNYLRNTHNFCTWCGVAYDDAEDLLSSCPGTTADSH